MTISIIVPIYNDEKHVKKCVDSLIKQTYKDTEIILVDDGSTDNSPAIIDEYAKNDSRIVPIHQPNGKLGAARNAGLKVAKGEYITFVDSDDWLDLECLERMHTAITKNNVDMAVCCAIREKDEKNYKIYFKYDKEEVISGYENITKALRTPPLWQVWGKLYKREILDNLFFEEGIVYEDSIYTFQVNLRLKNIITVPEVKYHYYSNNNSIMKSKHTIAKTVDKLNSMINVLDLADENNIELKKFLIKKEGNFFYKTKTYNDKKDLYVCGLKIFSKKEKYNTERTFLVFNTAYLGDTLLCNSLCQNIKKIYPKSKIIFIVNKPMYQIAKYQKDVDEVIVYDKKGAHKTIFGLFKFIKEFKKRFPNVNIYASFVTYYNLRNKFIAKLLKSDYIFVGKKGDNDTKAQLSHLRLLQPYTNKKLSDLPIKYDVPNDYKYDLSNLIDNNKKTVSLCCISKNPAKDMPLQTANEIINLLNNNGYNVILVGAGNLTAEFTQKLYANNCKFIDLVNKTSIIEFASILKQSDATISVDTGTMHLSYALGTATVGVFYQKDMTKRWAPDSNLYPHTSIVDNNQTAENIILSMKNLIVETVNV